MGKKALVTIIRDDGNIALTPEPASYGTTTTTMMDSGTSVSGKTLGSVVREAVAKISLSWRYLTKEEWANINALFKTQEGSGLGFANKVIYFDQTTGDWVSEAKEMIVSDRSAGMSRYDAEGRGVEGWFDCTLELTEV